MIYTVEKAAKKLERLIDKMERDRKKILQAAEVYALCKATGSFEDEMKAYKDLMNLIGVEDY